MKRRQSFRFKGREPFKHKPSPDRCECGTLYSEHSILCEQGKPAKRVCPVKIAKSDLRAQARNRAGMREFKESLRHCFEDAR